MKPDLYLGMHSGDLDGKPYSKYWNPNMMPVRSRVTDAIAQGAMSTSKLLKFHEAGQIQRQSQLLDEIGFGFFEDGSAHIAVVTEMPGVSPEAIDWWFAWHSDEPQRYKLWHPHAHVHASWGDKLPTVPCSPRLKYIGRPSHVWEYIGPELDYYRIHFRPPAEFGLDETELDPGRATAVCARVGFVRLPIDFGYLMHYVVGTVDGAIMYSRFWIGGPHISARSTLVKPLSHVLKMLKKPSAVNCERLLVHCAEEMSHLATFLPALHRELS